MGIILDSGVFIAAERKGWSVEQLLESLIERFGSAKFALSVVSIAELSHGLSRSRGTIHEARQARFLKDCLSLFRAYELTELIALRVGEIGAEMTMQGVTVDFQDLVIGVTALSHSHAILTNNPRHFRRIPGLLVYAL